MKVKYLGTSSRIIPFPGPKDEMVLVPNQEYTVFDEDAEKSSLFLSMLQAGTLLKTGDVEPKEVTYGVDADHSVKVETWIISGDTDIDFASPTYSGTHGTPVAVTAVISNAAGQPDIFNSVETVIVTITGGSATTKKISYKQADGTYTTLAAGPVTVTAIDGVFYLKVDAATSGDITLGLSSPLPVVLTVTSTATITLA